MTLAPLLPLLTVTQSVAFRPPAVPLVACDPYFSIWSAADRLTDVPTTHWTGRPHRLTSLIRIDGKTFRLMGSEPQAVPALPQTGLIVRPTQTVYSFAGAGVQVSLTFLTPALPRNLEILSRPVTYLTWTVQSSDNSRHRAELYFDNTSEPVVDEPSQAVGWRREGVGDLCTTRFGSIDQRILGKTGDDRRIDWGYLYTAAPKSEVTENVIAKDCSEAFVATGKLPPVDDTRTSCPVNEDSPVAAFTFDLGQVSAAPVSRWLMLAYDDLFSIQYFGHNLRPYWRRHGMDAKALLTVSAREYSSLVQECSKFDRELEADSQRLGGEEYKLMASLAYRQCLAGNKIAADANGQPILFPKENTSNGCIGTVDVIYPMSPQFLLFGPSLTKAMLVANLDYASSPRWKWPFAPHDLGTYPKANGQVYGGGERTEEDQMPIEETGNMLILLDALAKMEGTTEFADRYWPVLTRWAQYLEAKGFDPENQLSTDDFMGHLAHNANLSIKATIGLASFASLCREKGLTEEANRYMSVAHDFATRWEKAAKHGDHTVLAFDQPNSWSQKYNLVWDRILGFSLYSQEVKKADVDYYVQNANPFGVALDSRQGGTPAKIDWSLWTATITGNKKDFDAITEPLFKYLNESPQRVAMGDLYNTRDGHHMGMQSRPVVGAFFLPFLYDRATWTKWAGQDQTRAKGWAPFPKPIEYAEVIPTSETTPQTWRYTTAKPGDGWFETAFDDSQWSSGLGGFGTAGTPGAHIGTVWSTDDIWIRREVETPTVDLSRLMLRIHHDEDAEVYLNGVLIASEPGYISAYEVIPLFPSATKAWKTGKNVLAVHCHQTTGGQYIDIGFVSEKGP